MKRFLLFASETYYPSGGWGDFVSDHETYDFAEIARAEAHAKYRGWSHIVDTETKKVIRSQYENDAPTDE